MELGWWDRRCEASIRLDLAKEIRVLMNEIAILFP